MATRGPCSAAICLTSSFSRSMFSFRFTVYGFGTAGGGASAAAGVNASPSIRIFSFGRYTMRNASLCPLSAIEWISMFRFLSVSTCLSVTVSNLASFFDLRQPIGVERPRRRPRLLEVGPVHLVRHDGRPFVHVGAEAA